MSVRKLVVLLAVGAMSLITAVDSDAATITSGGEDTELSFSTNKNSSKVVVKALNLKNSSATAISIKNKYGRVIYTESLSNRKNYHKQYEFSNLEAGRYTLVLENTTKEMSKPFVVGMDGVVREDYRSAFENFAPQHVKNEEKQAYDFGFTATTSDFTPAALRQDGVR